MVTIFKYLKEQDDPISRPIAIVNLKSRDNKWVPFQCYIDSGADITLLPFSVGKSLGFNIMKGNIAHMGRVRRTLPVIYNTIQMRIGEKEFDCKVAWAMRENVPPLLGRLNIFDHFNITFKQTQGEIIFEEK